MNFTSCRFDKLLLLFLGGDDPLKMFGWKNNEKKIKLIN